MTLESLLVLIAIIAVGYFVVRWGSAIFLGAAVFYVSTAQWTAVALALLFAFFVEVVKQVVIGLLRATGAYQQH